MDSFLLAGQISSVGLGISALLVVFAYFTKQPWRFKAVGYTGFLGVLTAGLFALTLTPITRTKVTGAKPFEVVFDRYRGRVVIAVSPSITAQELVPTLQQARVRLVSSGRRAGGAEGLEILARTLVEVEPGVTQVIPLGRLRLPLNAPPDQLGDVELETEGFALLAKIQAATAP